MIVVRYREWRKRGGDERNVGRNRSEIDDLGQMKDSCSSVQTRKWAGKNKTTGI